MDDQGERYEPGPVVRFFHAVAPWVALAVVVWMVFTAFVTFQRAPRPTGGVTLEPVATSTPSGTTTSTAVVITGKEAVVVVKLKLRALPDEESEILATAKAGDVLDILVKDAGHYYKVRDASGHVGWIPSDAEFVTVRDKK